MVDGKLKERFAFVNPTLVSKVGMGEATKENKSTKKSYNSCYCEALCYFSDIINVHNVVSTFLFYVILFFLQASFHQVSLHLTSYHWWSSFPARYYSNLSSMFI